MDGGSKVLKGAAALLATGLNHAQHRFRETAAGGALRAEGKLAPDDRVTQRAFARVVRRFDSFATDERPEPVTMFVQLPTHADQRRVTAPHTAQKEALHLAADRRHATNQCGAAAQCSNSLHVMRRKSYPRRLA